MKKIFKQFASRNLLSVLGLCILSCISLSQRTFAQTQSPCDAHPFCSDTSYNFPNATSGNIPSTVDSGCLFNAPSPIWYWMQIGTAGTMQFNISQQSTSGTPLDVDFAMYGPFTTLAAGCAAVMAGAAPIQCSYSGSATETAGLGLPGGVPATTPTTPTVGQVYLVLITNFASLSQGSAAAGTISFSQTSGTGSADCNIVCGLSASNSGNVCFGNTVTLSAANTDTTRHFTYYWSGPGGYTNTGGVVGYAPTAPGTYTFDVLGVTDVNDTCHAETSVTIYPRPNVALVDGTDKVLCNTGSTPLAIANPTTGDTYQWYKNGVALPNDTLPTLSVDSNGSYKVVAQSVNGCMDSSNAVSVILNFTHVDFDYVLNKGCSGDTVHFTNQSEPGQYWWNFGDMTFPEDTTVSPTHIYNVQNTYIVRLKMKDLDGCVDSAIKIINTSHPLNAAFTQSLDSICQNAGTPVQFTDASIGNIQGWQWYFGDGGNSTQQNPTHIYSVSGTKNIQLIIHDDIPCYDTATSSIRVDSVPFLSFTQDRHAICEGEKVNFVPAYLQTAYNLNWDFGDGTVWNQLGNTSHSYEKSGTYTITLVGDYGVCGIATHTDSVVVNSFPIVNLGPDTVLCLDGPSITVTDNINQNDPTVKWIWNTGATTPSITIVHPGTYSVTASRNDCATTENVEVNKDCYTDIPNAFSPNGDGVNDYFYPRQLLSKGVVAFTMTIYDRWGQKIFVTDTPNGRGWDGKFNGKDQPTGVYIYQMTAVLKNGRKEDYTGNLTLLR